ncbi:MAG: ABC transporter permease [Burkholderiales bacterium]|jgi:ABC-2 type transport system permease protein|nr:ABC transporter permease [Burkholderiales bacterium]
MTGLSTLFRKELLRFWKVSLQTVAAPVLSSLLYLLIFSHAMTSHIKVFGSVPYPAFLIPGLAMMSVLQNAFANTSSSLIQSKITGNLVFVLLSPLKSWELLAAYVGASVVRGLSVGLGLTLVALWFVPLEYHHPLWILVFAILGASMLASLGIVAGIWAEKFDQMAAFQNFIIVPATFLSGVFYSVKSLPPFWTAVSHFNPFFYLVDGFRYGFFGISDISPWICLIAALIGNAVCGGLAWSWLHRGYKLRN